MAKNRPIDILRNSGGLIQVGTEGDDSAIECAIPTKEKLYIVKRNAIYGLQLADQIDPDRVDPAMPHTQQRILSVGSQEPYVARTLLTADVLFRKTALGQSFEVERGLEPSLELLKDVIAMVDTRTRLEEAQTQAIASLENIRPNHNTMPLASISNIEARFASYAQKAGHAIDRMEEITRLFYGAELEGKWVASLNRIVQSTNGKESEFATFLKNHSPFILLLREMRNMIEHQKPNIKVRDFQLLPLQKFQLPSVEILQPNQPPIKATIRLLMERFTEDLVRTFEFLLAHLCSANIRSVGMFDFCVVNLPIEERKISPNIRFSYGYRDGERVIPLVVG